MRMSTIARLVTVLALSLAWIVPVCLGFSAFLECMRLQGPASDDEMVYGISCVHLARSWFLLAAGVSVVVAVRAGIRRLLRRAERRAASSDHVT